MIDITGLDQADLLARMFNHSAPIGWGVFQAQFGPKEMTTEHAQKLLEEAREAFRAENPYFDYVYGRPLKVRLGGDTVDPRLYDREHGQGALAQIVAQMRSEQR